MGRFIIDTNILIYIITEDFDSLSNDVKTILDDYESEILISMETVRELIVAFRRKKLLSKTFRSSLEMIDSLQRDYGVRIVQTDMEVMRTLAKMTINEAEEHNDPSDHIIIAQAITMRLPLISSDRKFTFYRNQGLDLIFNEK